MTSGHELDNWRNRIAVNLCNFILQTVATKTYADFVAGAIRLGMIKAAENVAVAEAGK